MLPACVALLYRRAWISGFLYLILPEIILHMKLSVAFLQTDIEWGSKEKNLAVAETTVRSLRDTDLAVLPEMFTTGFMACDTSMAEDMEGESIRRMLRLAAETGTAVCGSIIIADGPDFYNRFILARPDGELSWYDKRHLFSFSGENGIYTPGTKREVWSYKGFRILPMVCYDLRFPVWSRNRCDYDVAVYSASWPQSRIGVWDTLLRARAIENQCYVLGVNRVGSDPSADYCGHSVAIDYYGNIIASSASDKPTVVKAELDKDGLEDFRCRFRAWEDADDFCIVP